MSRVLFQTRFVIDGISNTIIGSPIPVGTQPSGLLSAPTTPPYTWQQCERHHIGHQRPEQYGCPYHNGCSMLYSRNPPVGEFSLCCKNLHPRNTSYHTATRLLLTPIPLPDRPYNIAVNPSGTHLYVANNSTSVLMIRQPTVP